MVNKYVFTMLAMLVSAPALAVASDPTAPPNYQDVVVKEGAPQQRLPSLQATLPGEYPAAILNQQQFALGERIGAYRLYKVSQDFVVLERAGKHYQIYLDTVSVKQTIR